MDLIARNTQSPRATIQSVSQFFHRPTIRNICIALLLFVVFMTMYMSLMGELVFVDEVEVFLNGYLVSRGGMLYRDVLSQHMPISYYIATVISWFCSNNSYVFRLGFYIIMSAILVALYFRHRKYTSPVALVVGPVFFLMVLPYHSLASSMLSDHWQGIGIGILLLELLRYLQTKRITVSTAIWISLAIQLSFGAAFLAAYAILPVMLAVIALQVRDYIRLPKEQRSEYLRRVLREDLMLVVIVLLPIVILLIYYAVNDNLANFIEGAYLINTEVYSKYIGGFGSDPLSAARAPFITFWHFIPATFSALRANPSDPLQIVTAIMLVSTIVVPIWLCVKRQFIAGIAWFVTCVMCGVRGFDGFHSMPYYFVSALSAGLIFSWCIKRMFKNKNYVVGICAIVLLCYSASKLPAQFQQTQNTIPLITSSNNRKEMLDTILEPDDPIHVTATTQLSYPFDYQRHVDYGAAISTPWTYEVYGEKELESLQTVRPKVVFYTPGADTWGFQHDEYGKDLAMYILTHYTQFERTDMWIRNDCVSDALKKLGISGTNLYLSSIYVYQYINIDEQGMCTEYIEPDRDITIIGLGMNTANYVNSCFGTLGLEVKNEDTGETVFATTIDTTKFQDCAYNRVNTDSYVMEAGVKYSINIFMADSEAGALAISVMRDHDQSSNDIVAYADYIEGEDWDYGIYLVEKRTAGQRSKTRHQQHLNLREDAANAD